MATLVPVYVRLFLHLIPDSWVVFALASVSLLLFSRKCEYGPSFTYAWLWLGIISWLVGSDDARALFYLTGFGLVVGWYAIQLVQRDIWSRILVYWSDYFPAWCTSPLVRLGDVLIHIAPFTLSLKYYDKVQPHHVFQAVCYERLYFFATEGRPIGDGSIVNKIYALQPPCAPGVFRSLQMLSTVGYFIAASVCANSTQHQHFLQALWLTMFLFVALSGLLPDAVSHIFTRRTTDWADMQQLSQQLKKVVYAILKEAPASLDELLTKAGPYVLTAGSRATNILVISNPTKEPPPKAEQDQEVSLKDLLERILKLESLVSSLRASADPPKPSCVCDDNPPSFCCSQPSPLVLATLADPELPKRLPPESAASSSRSTAPSRRTLHREAARQLHRWHSRRPSAKCVCSTTKFVPPADPDSLKFHR